MSDFDAFPVVDSPPSAVDAKDEGASFDAFPAVAAPEDTSDQVSRGVANGRNKQGLVDSFKAAFAGESLGSLAKQNAVARLSDVLQDKANLTEQIEGSDEYKAKVAELTAAGERNPEHKLQGWLNDQVEKQWQASRPKAKESDIDFTKVMGQVKDAVLDNPGRFAGELVKSAVVDPELFLPWSFEFGLAKTVAGAGKAAKTVARSAEVAAGTAALNAPVAAMQQYQDTGGVNVGRVASESAAAGAAMGVLHAGASALGAATELGLRSIAKKKGGTVTAEVRADFDNAVQSAVAEGKSPTEALVATLQKHGMDEKNATAIGRAVDEHTPPPDEPPAAGTQEIPNATDQKGPQGEGGDVEGVRDSEGDQGVLRDGEQGQGEGAGQETPEVKPSADAGGPAEPPPAAAPVKKATPDRTLRVMLGRNGARTIEFDHPMDKEVFILASRAGKRLGAKSDRELAAHNQYVSDNTPRVQKWLGAKTAREAVEMAQQYRQQVIDHAKLAGEDARFAADSSRAPVADQRMLDASTAAKTATDDVLSKAQGAAKAAENEATRVSQSLGHEPAPLEFERVEVPKTAPAKTEPLPTGQWYHYTREPGVETLRVDKANPGNARGAAIYVAKDATFAASHSRPRVDKQGNLSSDKTPGELLKVNADEARMFDESRIWPADEAHDFLERAGATSDEASAFIGKRKGVAGESLNKELKRMFAGNERGPESWKYSNAYLKELGHTGVKFKDKSGHQLGALFDDVKPERMPGGKQAGAVSTELLATLGLAALGGLGVYALTHDKTEAIAAAAAAGALPYAAHIVGRLGKGTAQIANLLWRDGRFDTKTIFRDYARNVQVPNYAVDAWQRGINALLTGVPDRKASLTKIRDYLQGHRDVALSAQEQAAATELRKFLDYMGERGQRADVLGNLLENYLPGLYQKKPFASWKDIIDALAQEDAFRGNYTGMSPASRHALQKIIPDYRTVEALIRAGKLDLVPLTDDPFEMAALYAKSLNKTIANKQLVETLKATPGPARWSSGDPIPLVVPITTREAAARIAQGNRIIAEKFDLPEETLAIMNKFDIMRAPRDYVPISHPSLEGLRVHQDIVEPLKLLFDTSDPSVLSKGLYALSMAAKSALFSFSLFHAGALATVTGTLAVLRPALWKALPAAYRALKSPEFNANVERALTSGLTLFHHVQDVDPSFLQRGLNLAEKYAIGMPAYTGMPLVAAVKTAKFAHKAINDFLWNTLHPTLKLGTWMAESKRWAEKNPAGKLAQGNREIATAVNDLYGGINWFELANNVDGGIARSLATALFSPQGRRWQQVLMLAPDWNLAALRGWTEGVKSMAPGLAPKASDSLYRTYLLTSGLLYLGAADYLQQKYTGEHIWQKDDWTYVDMGDGRRIQLNKHFMEGVHLLAAPSKFILNKLNYIPKEVLAQLFDKEYVTPTGGPPMKGSRITHAVRSFGKPISVDNLMNNPASAVGGFFGIPIYGTTYAQQEAKARADARAAGKDEEQAARRVQKRAAKAEDKRATNRSGS